MSLRALRLTLALLQRQPLVIERVVIQRQRQDLGGVEILCLSTDSLNEPLLVSFFSITLNRFT